MTKSNRLQRFFCGRGYVVLTAILIFLGHSTIRVGERLLFGGYQEFLFGSLMIFTVCIACFVCDDLRFFVMPVISFIFIVPTIHSPNIPYYSRFYLEHIPITLEYVLLMLLVGSLICFMARNRANRMPHGKAVFVSMAVFCAALMLNGLFSPYHCIQDVIYPLTMIAALPLCYLLFGAYVRFDRSAFRHFLFCIVVLGMLLCAQMLFVYLDPGPEGVRLTASGSIEKGSLVFGWGISTAIGGMLAFLMPACFWFARSHRHGWIYLLCGGVEYGCIILSQSRGALLAGTVVLVLSALLLLTGGKNRRINRVLIGIALVTGVGIAVKFFDKLVVFVRNHINDKLADHGRFQYWETGIRKFFEYPVFGAGFYNDFAYTGWQKDGYPYLYHNTPVQLLASGGLVAFGAYVYHRICTVVLALRRPDPIRIFLFLCILGLLIFCLFDVIFFSTYPTIIYSLMLLYMQKDLDMRREEKTGNGR